MCLSVIAKPSKEGHDPESVRREKLKNASRDHWGDLGVDGWIILGRTSGKLDVGIWTGLGWPRMETYDGRL